MGEVVTVLFQLKYLRIFAFAQVRILLEKARALSKKWDRAPVVIAGDFNSTPQVFF